MRFLLAPFFIVFCFNVKAQTTAPILVTDSLADQVILYVPTATTAQITSLQSEFAGCAQIQSAIYVTSHKCIVIDMGDVANKRYYIYAQLVKAVGQYISPRDIKIKSATAYSQVKAGIDSSSITIK